MNIRKLKHRHYVRLYILSTLRNVHLCDYTPLSQWVKLPDKERAESGWQIFLRDRVEIERKNFDD